MSSDILMYSVDGTTGALTPNGMVASGMYPYPVVVDPSGRFAYVANGNSNTIGFYPLNPATGALTPVGTLAAGTSPSSLAITAKIQ